MGMKDAGWINGMERMGMKDAGWINGLNDQSNESLVLL